MTKLTVFQAPWMRVYKTDSGFFFAERKGINSVAFALLREDGKIGLTREFKIANDQFVITAFGGSVDDEAKCCDPIYLRNTVKKEVLEESGFIVSNKNIKSLGRVLCSTQMNQWVYLYLVDIDSQKKIDRTTKDRNELTSSVVWLDESELYKLNDWKAITIFYKNKEKTNAKAKQFSDEVQGN